MGISPRELLQGTRDRHGVRQEELRLHSLQLGLQQAVDVQILLGVVADNQDVRDPILLDEHARPDARRALGGRVLASNDGPDRVQPTLRLRRHDQVRLGKQTQRPDPFFRHDWLLRADCLTPPTHAPRVRVPWRAA